MRCVEAGPVKRVLRVASEYGASRLVQDFAVYRELDYVKVKTRVDWHEKHAMLKLVFPMELNYLQASWEIPYGVLKREADGEEYPMQGFVDVEGANSGLDTQLNGLSFLNDKLTSGSVRGKEAALTVLRSPVYSHHEPYELQETREYVYLDQGVTEFTYALYPHGGCWEKAESVRRSRALNEVPFALFETYHRGNLSQSDSLLSVEARNVLLTVLKEAEDGSHDVILRLVERAGVACRTSLSWRGGQRTVPLRVEPFEIKTLRLTQDGEFWETDLLEERL